LTKLNILLKLKHKTEPVR